MYRIIGITEDGSLKVIKNTPLEDTMAWGASQTVLTTWPNSNIYTSLNGDGYLNNFSNMFKGAIEETTWKYGTRSIASSRLYKGSTVYGYENGFTTSVDAKIGLMYIHDYLFAYPGGEPNSAANALTSWINGSTANTPEYTITIKSQSSGGGAGGGGGTTTMYYAYLIQSNGIVNVFYNTANKVRPVFYINSNAEFVGTGTDTDPYILFD